MYTLKQHKYSRENFVSVYVTDDNRALDMHKHFMEAGGHSEHAWFISRLQTPRQLQRIAQGPKNFMPVVQKQKAKAKMPEELLARLQAPSRRGLAENRVAIKLPDGEALHPASPFVVDGAGSAISFPALPPQDGFCKARIWADGLLNQCTAKTGDDFCRRHRKEQSHGRIDQVPPAEIADKAQKYLCKKSRREYGCSQISEQSQAKRKEQNGGGVH